MAYIKQWNALNHLNPDFSLTIKSVNIFGKNAIFIITHSDNVYSFGSNTRGCLGLGHSNQVTEPQIINELCNKHVNSIKIGSYNSSNVLALTKSGRVYSWGDNHCGQLANGNTIEYFKPKTIQSINHLKINAIRCGGSHCLAMTDNGKLFGWGNNHEGMVGIGNNQTPITTPTQLIFLNDHKIVAIECGANQSFALTEEGILYSWGFNPNGQLGIGHIANTNVPTKLNIGNNILVRQIRCGYSHSIFLSSDGDIYSFGCNGNGQIGDGTKQQKTIPVKLNIPFKCVDIAANNYNGISIAKLENQLCYVWGECSDQSFTSPYVTEYEHINDVIIHYSKFKWNYDHINNDLNNTVISKRFIASFNNPKYSDIAFKIEDKIIYVQKMYLISVCNHFESMFSQNNWNENSGNEVMITQFSYPVYHAFLKYLYTNSVDIENEYLFDLLDLANSYFENELKLKCAQIIENEINCENVCAFYSSAVKYNLNELKDSCYTFALKNFDSIKQTDGYKQTQDVSFLKALIDNMIIK